MNVPAAEFHSERKKRTTSTLDTRGFFSLKARLQRAILSRGKSCDRTAILRRQQIARVNSRRFHCDCSATDRSLVAANSNILEI